MRKPLSDYTRGIVKDGVRFEYGQETGHESLTSGRCELKIGSARHSVFLIAVVLMVWSASSQALGLRYGGGDFKVNADLAGVLSSRMSMPVQTWSIIQEPVSPAFLPLDFSFRLDLFDSQYTRQFADMASQAAGQNFPIIGLSPEQLIDQYTPVPVPADYRVYGSNLDIALSRKVINEDNFALSLGINTGLSVPFMKTRNLQSDANLLFQTLDAFSTELTTYKLGPMLGLSYQPAAGVQLNGILASGLQTGKLDNTALTSSFTMDGHYWTMDLSLNVALKRLLGKPGGDKGWQAGLGYQRSRWYFDSASVEFNNLGFTTPPVLDFDFSHESLYLSLSYFF
ncbi:MAG: hypothetical protein ACWA44_10270 [Thiotrichales bacterium]